MIGLTAIAIFTVFISTIFLAVPSAAAQVTIARNGKLAAVVVTAEEPSRTAVYAAEELARHIEKSTGTKLQVVPENSVPDGFNSRIFLGITKAALGQGIEPEKLGPDEFILRTIGSDLYILGNEMKDIDPLRGVRYDHSVLPAESVNSYSGTLFGIYELLGRYVGVRWLWPGDLGTYIPRAKNIVIAEALDEKIGPRLQFRLWDWPHIMFAKSNYERADKYRPEVKKLAFSKEGILKYRDDLEVYQRRHRLGNSQISPHGVHTFEWWWGRYGKTHPEWFMLKPNGERGPAPMCVSNPELHKYIVERYLAGDLYVTGWVPPDRIAYAGFIPLGEADGTGWSKCNCEECKKWNGPQPENYPDFAKRYYNPLQSNRYARFWKTIYDMAVEKDPDVKISTYIYHNTFPAPTDKIELNKNIWGEFAPYIARDSYYPMPEESEKWVKQQWTGWKNTGMSMVYRPNYTWHGYVMPHLSTWQAGEFFRWAYKNGMVATSYDALFGHWATRGPMLYMLMRLFWNPELEIADIRKEYFSGFGPAAGVAEKYFDYWEEHSRTRKGVWSIGEVYTAFPPSVFPPAEAMLKDALKTAQEHPLPEFSERVKFLQAGLEHARLAVELMASLDSVSPPGRKQVPLDNPERLEKVKELLRELIEFRRKHEHLYISDYLDASISENRIISNMAELLEDIQ